jgi:hypothetical protein
MASTPTTTRRHWRRTTNAQDPIYGGSNEIHRNITQMILA